MFSSYLFPYFLCSAYTDVKTGRRDLHSHLVTIISVTALLIKLRPDIVTVFNSLFQSSPKQDCYWEKHQAENTQNGK